MRRLLAVAFVASLVAASSAGRARAAGDPAVAFSAGSDEEVVQRVHVRISGSALTGTSCGDAIDNSREPGIATINYQFKVDGGQRDASQRYTGTVTFSLPEVVVTLPSSISWPRMSAADHERAETLRRAIYHHEIGHVRVAEAVRDRLNAREPIDEPDPFAFRSATDAIGRDGFDLFRRQEREYDALTDHGRKQHAAPGVLAGPDTVIVCR